MLQLLPIAMAATVAVFVFAAYTLAHQHNQSVDTQARICRVANGDRMVLRNLLKLAQTNSRISLKGHPAQLARAQAFYVQALALIKPVNCQDL
jgi:hypothetical protein